VNPRKQPYKISNQRLRELGLEFTPAAQALYDTVVCFQEKGILPLPVPAPTPASPDA
jgi:cinnamoyl-CoA reductase